MISAVRSSIFSSYRFDPTATMVTTPLNVSVDVARFS
ncbi:MAG: hypothetical protein ACI83Y_000714 [Candidatus Azotimanducaceae bacterium]